MTRRTFAALLAIGPGFSRGDVVLEAVYGAKLPHTLRLNRKLAGAGNPALVEIRVYEGKGSIRHELAQAFMRAEVQPVKVDDLTFLFRFPSLEKRAKAWDRVNADPEWAAIRNRVRLKEMTIYRRASTQPGGRIFDISL